ncbi:glycerol-3-phosphate dehydrogenase/oxidase [Ureibacillus acetophenoni]|uniref:Aerobic glycerol-3-phosphate dehydrogenase n=1 Tax=Ureibacillus acetophenoni TaxID=614649 RepID=A0A285UAW1_9BACL|nr:glycerol-3-phosphate dehydrogenase/oxidase [Ureibacillus acetophenoni]SOC38558.1 homodimeric glycerol 3-phosphate dehydrogenase (quinone) [Ureibacillus acetophenoni]
MSHPFSAFFREEILQEISNERFDLIVIGGGITGCGISLDAATRGLKTVVFEMQDFASGTSSRSSKLIHGGLRYLKQFEVKMVSEVGKERKIVYENGPHVTIPERMILPIYKGATYGKFMTSLGLRLYDFLAGVVGSEKKKMLDRKETLEREPLLKDKGLVGAGDYVEYRTDDARLTMEVIKQANYYGAKAINYTKVDSYIYENNNIAGVHVTDQITGKKYQVFGSVVVNASGPWVDLLREKDQSKKGKKIQHTKGVHLVIDQKHFPLKQSIYFDTPDGRMLLAIPREGKTYIGTTDTKYEAALENPKMTKADIDYIINAMNEMFPSINLSNEHIESSWVGIRPLIYEDEKGMSEISRKDEIWHSDSGLITIAGGKLTGYRKMAEMAVNDVISRLKEINKDVTYQSCQTKKLPISGGDVGGSKGFFEYKIEMIKKGIELGLTEKQAAMLVNRYGSNVNKLFSKVKDIDNRSSEYNLPIVLFAMLQYSIEEEMVVKPTDFFIRRTGYLLFDIEFVRKYKDAVIAYMGDEFNWNYQTKKDYESELNELINDSVYPIVENNKNSLTI